jgi:hypothetical protein
MPVAKTLTLNYWKQRQKIEVVKKELRKTKGWEGCTFPFESCVNARLQQVVVVFVVRFHA